MEWLLTSSFPLPLLNDSSIHFKTFVDISTIVNESRSINILGVASDVGIAATLIFLLQRSRTGFRRSETIINRLILFTINTGLLTSMAAAMSLISVGTFSTEHLICVESLMYAASYDRFRFGQIRSSTSHSSCALASVRYRSLRPARTGDLYFIQCIRTRSSQR